MGRRVHRGALAALIVFSRKRKRACATALYDSMVCEIVASIQTAIEYPDCFIIQRRK